MDIEIASEMPNRISFKECSISISQMLIATQSVDRDKMIKAQDA